jgi:hypothetical protein
MAEKATYGRHEIPDDAMQLETMTVTVPSALVEQLRQRAQQRQHSLDEELVEAPAKGVTAEGEEASGDDHTPSATDDLVAERAPAQAGLAMLADEALWQTARTSAPSPAAAAYLEELSFKRQRGVDDRGRPPGGVAPAASWPAEAAALRSSGLAQGARPRYLAAPSPRSTVSNRRTPARRRLLP